MGSLVDTGLGWYLDEDYLLTTGSTRIARISNSRFLPLDSSGVVRNLAKFDLKNEPYRIFYAGTEDSGIYSFFLKGVSSGGDLLAGVYLISNQTFTAHIGCTSGETVIYDVPTATPLFDSQTGYYYLPVALVGSGTYSYDTVPADLDNTFYMSLINVPNSISDYINVLFGTSTIGRIRPVLSIPYDMGQGATLTQLNPMVETYAFWGRTNGNITPFVVTEGAIISIDGTGQNGFRRDHEVYMEYALHSWLAQPSTTRPSNFPYIEAQSWGDILTVALGTLGDVSPLSIDKEIAKVNGGPGSFAVVTYPHNGGTVCVGVGISSIGVPNSAATVAVDGTNGSYNTFNREGMQFTMFYTEQLTGTLTADVPVVTLDTDISALPGLYEARLFLAVADAAQVHVGFVPADEDPYAGGGTSIPSGGTPDFTEVSESISQGSTFPISFQSTGLCRVYVPSITDLNDLANYLWTDQTFLDTIKNILINQFENFMEAVISLTMVPCQVPKGTAQPVKVMFLSTGLSFPPATQQFVEVDCGYVDITERYASALDYNPYTKVSLYLPFIGTVPLDTDEVMGHRLKCVYTIDIVSGACVAKIMVDYPDSSNGVLYQFSGHCSISMPLTAADFSSYYAAAMSGLKMAAGLAAAGAGAPGLGGALLGEPTAHPSSTTTTTRTTARNAATGRQILAGTESQETSHTPGQASFKELATRASVNTVGTVINSKFSVEHSGGFTGNTGFLGVQAPYVIITRPDMCNPDEYGAYNGRPSMMYLYLGNLSGFTQVQNIKLTGIPATNPELGEIAELLKTGVIL